MTNTNRKYILAGLIGLASIIGWNVFLIQRDQMTFNAYDKLTPKEQFCKQQSGWHPDCNLE